MIWNDVTSGLKPYPMEELALIRAKLTENNQQVFDFGTGDPKIPTWPPIKEALSSSVPSVSQYPSVRGNPELRQAIWGYVSRQLGLSENDGLDILPSAGSKEAVFHVALSLIGRAGGKDIIMYPNPGYPVYRSSTLFAGGRVYPLELNSENNYLMEPWSAPVEIQSKTAAIWVNYPHNPTGKTVDKSYLEKLIEWCDSQDVILLSDDCYIDIYNEKNAPNEGSFLLNPVQISKKNIISFMSLSKRSGMTGYRSGFMLGEKSLMAGLSRARANFGVASPDFVQKAAAIAWADDVHVAHRRKLFQERIDLCVPKLKNLGLLDEAPEAAFYLWCRVPNGGDDISFCKGLAEKGVIASPSQWLSEGIRSYFRLALVPELDDIEKALDIIEAYVKR